MDLLVEQRGAVTVVAVIGSVDALTADDLVAAFKEQIEKGNAQLVADLGGVDYASSAGLRALLIALKESRQQGGDLRLAAVQKGVHRVLDLSGFTSIVKMYPAVDDAIASFDDGNGAS